MLIYICLFWGSIQQMHTVVHSVRFHLIFFFYLIFHSILSLHLISIIFSPITSPHRSLLHCHPPLFHSHHLLSLFHSMHCLVLPLLLFFCSSRCSPQYISLGTWTCICILTSLSNLLIYSHLLCLLCISTHLFDLICHCYLSLSVCLCNKSLPALASLSLWLEPRCHQSCCS